MTNKVVRLAIAPAYVLLCLLLGGSTRGVWGNLALQVIAVAMIAWAAVSAPRRALPPAARGLGLVIAALALLVALQLLPLPPAWWTMLPGRDPIAQGYRALGVALPWLPVSLAPYATIVSVQWLLPPLAVLAVMLRLGAFRASWIAIAIIAATMLAIILGILQRGSADPLHSLWYLYPFVNYGQATGFFANGNHMATLLVCTIPFMAALAGRSQRRNAKARRIYLTLLIGGTVIVALGLALNGSLAGIGLGLPVVAATLSLRWPTSDRRLRLAMGGAALLIVAAIGVVAIGSIKNNLTGAEAGQSFESRRTTFARTIEAARDHLPFGSGIGSFANIYPRYEPSGEASLFFVNHAHNDYLEVALETGLPGILLIVAFLWWWARRTVAIWRAPTIDLFARAATVASAAMVAHSLVDFPLRTSALAALFAACLALMLRPRGIDTESESAPGTRHWSVG